MRVTPKRIGRLGKVVVEVLVIFFAMFIFVFLVGKSMATDPYGDDCGCSEVEQTTEDLFGGIECQHGPEQDVDCIIWHLTGQAPIGSICTDNGDNAPNNPKGWNDLTAQQKADMIARGFTAADVDGKCECFKCQNVNTVAAQGECEFNTINYGAWCERDGLGNNCPIEDGVMGPIQKVYKSKLKNGVMTCTDSGGDVEGDGSGGGTNKLTYCDDAGPGTNGQNSLTGANCISTDCEADLQALHRTFTDVLKKCK